MARLENSPGLEAALARARRVACLERADVLSPRHLLFGLLADDDGLPFRMVTDQGVNPARIHSHLLQAYPTAASLAVESDLAVESEDLPIANSPGFAHVLRRARQAVSWHSPEGTLTTDLVFLALLEQDGDSRYLLIELGLDWDRWQQEHALQSPMLELDEPLHLEGSQAPVEVARLLDACANRAREALRVLEDYTRFVLDDAFLTRQLKILRHDLVEVLSPLTLPFVQARDTLEDVGTSISTQAETKRESVQAVAVANVKRLQEALRSMEEFGKIHSPHLGQVIEQLRYRSYTLERALVLRGAVCDRLTQAKLYLLLTETLCRLSWIGTAREALDGGVDVIQLREKDLDDQTLLQRAKELRRLTREHDALFIVNDRPDIARLSDADGVHLGQEDLSVRDARRILGGDALIGVSTHNLDQVRQAVLEGATYLGVGPTFPSHTKQFNELAGVDFVRLASEETTLPSFALGGISAENLESVVSAGARRIAVSHAICAADDPQQAARELRRMLP